MDSVKLLMEIVQAIHSDSVLTLQSKCDQLINLVGEEILNISDKYGNSLLMVAARLGSLKCVLYLLNNGASCEVINVYGQNVMSMAAYSGNIDIVLLLLQKLSYNEYSEMSTVPPICIAAMESNWDLVKLFVHLNTVNKAEENYTKFQKILFMEFSG